MRLTITELATVREALVHWRAVNEAVAKACHATEQEVREALVQVVVCDAVLDREVVL